MVYERSEHDEQCALVEWLELNRYKFTAIPNGGHRSIGQAKKLKAEGVRGGLPDMLVIRNGRMLFLEMKRESLRPKRGGSGGVSADQRGWIDAINRCADACAVVCYSFDEARDSVEKFFRYD